MLVSSTWLLLAALLFLPASASALASPYGHRTITYRDKTTYKWQVTEAFAVWNRAGTPFRFRPARPGKRADIVVTQKRYLGGSPNSAVAGYGGHGFVQLSAKRLHAPKAFAAWQVKIVAHEIGHSMGLGHSANRCAVMYSSVDYPNLPKCATVETEWDARQFCGPRKPDIKTLARRTKFRPKAVAWLGYCTTPTDASKAATAPYVAGTLAGETTQDLSSGTVQLTVTNNGNTLHEIGSYGIVIVDANGTILTKPWSFFPDGYYAVSPPPAPGQSTSVNLPPCNAELPAIIRVRLASLMHDAFLSPVLQIRLDTLDAGPTAPANECTNAA